VFKERGAWIERALLAGAVILLPFNGLPYFADILRELSKEGSFYPMLGLVLFGGAGLFSGRRLRLPRDPSAKWLWAFLGWLAISALVNLPLILVAETKGRTGAEKLALQTLLLGFGVVSALMTYNVLSRVDRPLERMKVWIGYSFALPALYSFFEVVTLYTGASWSIASQIVVDKLIFGGTSFYGRVRSVCGESSYFALYAIFLFPWLAVEALRPRRPPAAALPVLALTGMVYLSFSRFGYLAVGAELLFILGVAVVLHRKEKSWKRPVWFAAGLLAVLFILSNKPRAEPHAVEDKWKAAVPAAAPVPLPAVPRWALIPKPGEKRAPLPRPKTSEPTAPGPAVSAVPIPPPPPMKAESVAAPAAPAPVKADIVAAPVATTSVKTDSAAAPASPPPSPAVDMIFRSLDRIVRFTDRVLSGINRSAAKVIPGATHAGGKSGELLAMFSPSFSNAYMISNYSRLGSLVTALRIAMANPVFGVGFGQYGFHMPKFFPEWAWKSIEIRFWADSAADTPWPPVLNLHARLAAESGFPGLALWAALWLTVLLRAGRRLAAFVRTADPRAWQALALFTGVFGVSLSGAISDSFRSFSYWIVLGAAWAFLDAAAGEKAARPPA